MSILQARVERGVAILDIEHELVGGPETTELHKHIRDMLRDGHKRILLNLRGVPWVNSIGLGTVVAAYATAKRNGAHLEICCASRRVEMVFQTTMLMPDLFREFRCEEEALRSFHDDDVETGPRPG
jgi:anti-sigma B factor antagonist